MTIKELDSTARRCAATAALVQLLLSLATMSAAHAFDLQGHRGARGLAPENTLAGFAKALEIGVTTLETDLAVTRDGAIVLVHDRLLNPDILRGPDGRWLASPGPAVFSLTLAELRRFDVGRIRPETKYARQLEGQAPVDGARIPTLGELFELAKASGKSPRFNIETKLSPVKPGEAPDPETFARLVIEAVRAAEMTSRTTIQSFDWRTLTLARRLAPEIETVCLTYAATLRDKADAEGRRPSPWLAGLDPANYGGSIPKLARAAGCGTWSPRFTEISAASVAEAHALGLKVVPWTVNAEADMARVIDLGMDGLITDYPDRARTVMAAKGIALPGN
jgi:glycerophosphoryl diester phosphodiesterase